MSTHEDAAALLERLRVERAAWVEAAIERQRQRRQEAAALLADAREDTAEWLVPLLAQLHRQHAEAAALIERAAGRQVERHT